MSPTDEPTRSTKSTILNSSPPTEAVDASASKAGVTSDGRTGLRLNKVNGHTQICLSKCAVSLDFVQSEGIDGDDCLDVILGNRAGVVLAVGVTSVRVGIRATEENTNRVHFTSGGFTDEVSIVRTSGGETDDITTKIAVA